MDREDEKKTAAACASSSKNDPCRPLQTLGGQTGQNAGWLAAGDGLAGPCFAYLRHAATKEIAGG